MKLLNIWYIEYFDLQTHFVSETYTRNLLEIIINFFSKDILFNHRL